MIFTFDSGMPSFLLFLMACIQNYHNFKTRLTITKTNLKNWQNGKGWF